MYVHPNYKTKKQLKEALAAGKTVTVYQPGGMFPCPTNGKVTLEGPHYPEPHKWYASGVLKDGILISVK